MAVTTNAQEKQELFKTIWKIADDLRGKVDGWDFKAYVLGTLFYRYLSENITDRINKQERDAGDADFDYALLEDADVDGVEDFREGLIKEIGFFLYPSQLFCNVVENASKDENLNMTLEKVFRSVEESAKGSESEKCFSGLFSDFDVNSNKLGATVPKRNETLVKLLTAVKGMDFGSYTDNTVDLLGDAYEFLMGMYASNAGKSGGEYFTPQEVSELLTKLAIIGKDRVNKVYDPACGSGSLLLKSAKILGKDKVDQGYFGQELNVTTYNLCRINMFLHNIGYDKFDIANEDTLTQPMHWDEEPFEVIVSNPPYSTNWVGEDDVTLINDPRYSPAGVLAPKTKADMAFIMHMISWLAPNGTAAIVCFPGIMYRGGAEQKIRKYLVDNNFIDAIIQLPSNLFFGTGIATCIMVMKKNKVDNNILFIDADKECIKDGNSNRLTEDNIDNILKYYTERTDVEYAVSLVPYDRVVAEKYSLSVSVYVEKEILKEEVDIVELDNSILRISEEVNSLRLEVESILKRIKDSSLDVRMDDIIMNSSSHKIKKYKLKDLAEISTGSSDRKDATDDGKYPFYVRSREVFKIDSYEYDETAIIIPGEGGIGEIFHYATGKYALHQRAYRIHVIDNRLLPRFLYYYMIANFKAFILKKAVSATVTSIRRPMIEEFEVPVPPLAVQEELIEILDKFTMLNELVAAERDIRVRQYEYYRDSLLSFERFGE